MVKRVEAWRKLARGAATAVTGAWLADRSHLQRMVILGDSFTEGTGAGRGRGFADLLDLPGCRVIPLGHGGTGAWLGRGEHATYGQRLWQVRLARPDWIAVMGSPNDRHGPTGDVVQAWTALLRACSGIAPGRVVAVEPVWVSDGADHARLRSVVGQAGREAGVPVISTGGWVTPASAGQLICGDGIHPSTDGHAAIAGLLAGPLAAFVDGRWPENDPDPLGHL